MTLKLAPGVSLPLEVVTQTIGILAQKRKGKSYTARRLVEQLHKAGQQVVIVDPKGDWWGVRSAADGKRPGLPIVIVGGERGDVPLEASGGELVAKLVVEERVSALLDLSLLRKHEIATFMTSFLENLYRLKAREVNRTPMMLVIDEADAIAPQKPQPNEARMLGAAEDIVRRGGQRGIGCTMISQRSAVLNKNVLSQIQVLVALCTIAPQDLAALNAWIDVHGTLVERAKLMESLPALPRGDAWWWAPGWPTDDGIFKRAHTYKIETFDSGATPKPGEKRVEPKNLADVDLDALRRQMADTIERAKADDPKALRAQIAELKARLGERAKLQTERVEVPVVDQAFLDEFQEVSKIIDTLVKRARSSKGIATKNGVARSHETSATKRDPLSWDDIHAIETGATRETIGKRKTALNGRDSALPKGEVAILSALIQYKNGLRREQLTTITGYKRSTRDAYLQRLIEKSYVSKMGDVMRCTSAGCIALPGFEPLPTGKALQAYHMERLPEGERAVLKVLIDSYPTTPDRDSITNATGYKRSTRDAYIQRLAARELVVAERGTARASETLFEEPR